MTPDRTLVITGGGAGIGAALVRALRDTWRVIVIDVQVPAEPEEGVEYLQGDLAFPDDVEALVDKVRERCGAQIDGLVHCAGIGRFGDFLTMPRKEWERVLVVNLHATLAIVQGLAPMISRNGRIVMFSSGTAFKGPRGAAAYAASKAGVIGFVRSMADELGERGITVNAVAPGLVVTALSKDIAHTEEANVRSRAIKRASTTADYIGPVRFLLSPGAGFVTGQTLVVDGGSIRR